MQHHRKFSLFLRRSFPKFSVFDVWNYLIALNLLLFVIPKSLAGAPDRQCQACKDFIETFRKGYENTANLNFGGGNTDWEETRLGSYSTSETRLVEILEHACTEGNNKDWFVENHEEQIEKWYFHLQNHEPDFEKWLCIVTAKVCCPSNTFGSECVPCPGMVKDSSPCFGRGYCEGNGTRKGSGKCRCFKGYQGDVCDTCGFGFFQVSKSDSSVECKDVDECELDPKTCVDNEYCFNTEGAYMCTKCHPACNGCTGSGAAKCRTCAEGHVRINGTCTAVSQGIFTRFLRLFDKFDKTLVFCGGGVITSYFFIKNGEYSKLGLVGVMMAVILSAWHYGDLLITDT
ncbi:cysteine-rich with EGF-like domain protein 2-A isoform X2 [Paramacrobiotus metropolitanus]|uniref:cysteine-rich with EGF-like domain protein 2-A isoform X2 n=1 Tax=Paramacrobiotus metropolitanus TaxID=2943436 RepID=UPI002445E16D|nr:cysteine-rich with EGF-like domain protein 2-A isoform X2 [Paramacrobiotus metropolitanus]